MKKNFLLKEALLYTIGFFLTLILLLKIMHLHAYPITLPRLYLSDALFSSAIVKSIIDTGWYLENIFLSAPGVLNFADYPMSDGASMLIIKLFAFVSHNFIIVLNCFYFFTFFMTTLVSLFVFRKFGLNRIFSLIASLLFTFLPYHMLRGEGHLFLNAYYVIPIYTLLIFSIYSHTASKKLFTRKNLILSFIACVFAASSGLYYAFFACYLLLVAGLFTSINARLWQPLIKTLVIVSFIVCTILVNTAPTIIHHTTYGANAAIATRSPAESEEVALKISQLLLPVDQHRIAFLREFKKSYSTSAPLINENRYATLGIIGSLGFLILISLLFIRESRYTNPLFHLSRLNIAAILLGTVGGFSSLFAYIISPSIRSYNRISIFIAFFALLSFFIVLQWAIKKWKPQQLKRYSYLLAAVIFLIGIFDEVASINVGPNYDAMKPNLQSDAHFVSEIEKRLPKNSMVFQLPVAGFPENPKINDMLDYELFKGYLHSHHLRWSYGALRGRSTFEWQQKISEMPLSRMVDSLVYTGFLGIYIDRRGFQDHAAQLKKELSQKLKQEPLVSENNDLFFFDLRGYKQRLQKTMTASVWDAHVRELKNTLLITQNWENGFYPLEKNNEANWHWSQQHGVVRLVNLGSKPLTINISFQVLTANTEDAMLELSGDLLNTKMGINNTPQLVSKQVILTPGMHRIYFNTNATKSADDSDTRKLHLKVNNFEVRLINAP
jgi:phosphoglycerol transferase